MPVHRSPSTPFFPWTTFTRPVAAFSSLGMASVEEKGLAARPASSLDTAWSMPSASLASFPCLRSTRRCTIVVPTALAAID